MDLRGCAWLVSCVSLIVACRDDGSSVPSEPLFPADYASSYVEVRDCRLSGDHEFNHVRVLADPGALASYRDRSSPFPVGSILMKEEYDDDACTMLVGFTAMQREPAGYDTAGGDWHWQKLDARRGVTQDGVVRRCRSCHEGCGVPPDGFDWTCAIPP